MKIKITEGYFSQLDIDQRSDNDEIERRASTSSANLDNKSSMDMFSDYVNRGRSPASICEDGRVIRPGIVKNMLKSFKKTFRLPNFNPTFVQRFAGGEVNTYIINTDEN